MPIAKISFSEFIVSTFSLVIISAETEFSLVVTDFKAELVLIFIPLFSKLNFTILDISVSSFGKIEGKASTIVTSTPKSL